MERQKRLEVLRRVAIMMRPDGPLLVLFGFLAGRIDHVRFVEELEGAGVAVQLSVESRVWPRVPFRSKVDGEVVLNPIALVDLLALRDDPLYVRVDFGYATPPDWYRDAAEARPGDQRALLEDALHKVRERIDFALDVYRTARPRIEASEDEAERKEMEFVVQTARDEIQSLTRMLTNLEGELAKHRPA